MTTNTTHNLSPRLLIDMTCLAAARVKCNCVLQTCPDVCTTFEAEPLLPSDTLLF